MLAANTPHQPQFISGMYFGAHSQSEVTENIIEPNDPPVATVTISNPTLAETKTTDDASGVANQKISPVEIKDAVPAILKEPDAVENKHVVPAAATKPVIVQTEEPGTTNSAATENNTDGAMDDVTDPVINKYAGIVGLDPTDINNYPLYRFIDEWYGTKYKWGGEDNTGIDCSAFAQKLYSKVYGLEILRTTRQQHKNCDRTKDPDAADEGDLIFFRIHRLGISHVGVYLANGYFVHASRSQGVVISNLNTRYWHKRFAACGKIQKEEKSGLESDYLQ